MGFNVGSRGKLKTRTVTMIDLVSPYNQVKGEGVDLAIPYVVYIFVSSGKCMRVLVYILYVKHNSICAWHRYVQFAIAVSVTEIICYSRE